MQFAIEELSFNFKGTIIESYKYAKTLVNINDEEINTIMHSRKSLLFNNTDIWIKKNRDPDFDVTMGSFDGAELCELLGLYILHILGEKYGKHQISLYRDDGSACFGYTSGPQADRIRKDFIKILTLNLTTGNTNLIINQIIIHYISTLFLTILHI